MVEITLVDIEINVDLEGATATATANAPFSGDDDTAHRALLVLVCLNLLVALAAIAWRRRESD